MRADDPRHGTEAGCREHYRHKQKPCDPCLEAHRRRNIMRRLYPHKRPSLGSRRRIQALQAIGYGRDRIARELGYRNGGSIAYLMKSDSLLAGTAERISDTYERLCMTVPQGVGPSRARTWAKRHGFIPPLAWTDIDDPDEVPDGWQYVPADRATAIRELAAQGENATHIARRLEMTRSALERWCLRHLPDVWRVLVTREGDWNATGNIGHDTLRSNAA